MLKAQGVKRIDVPFFFSNNYAIGKESRGEIHNSRDMLPDI